MMVKVIHVQVRARRVKLLLLLFACLLLIISHLFIILTCPKNSFGGRSCRFEELEGLICTNVFNQHLLLHWQLRERTADLLIAPLLRHSCIQYWSRNQS